MFVWAADPERGNLLPDHFRNPFAGKNRRTNEATRDPFGEPDITLNMAREFLASCDRFQLPLFSVLVFYGLRAAEPCLLFRENIVDGWLKVACNPALAYVTKGRRDKRFPLIAPLQALLEPRAGGPNQGLLFLRRNAEGTERPSLLGASLAELATEFAIRSQQTQSTAENRHRCRNSVLRDAGAIDYDLLENEFRRVARQTELAGGRDVERCPPPVRHHPGKRGHA
jgi:integrase